MPIRIWVNSDIYKNYLTSDLSAALNRFQNEEASQPAGTSPSSLGSTSTVFSPPLPEVPQVKHAEPNQETGKVDGWNPANQLRLVVYNPIIYKVFAPSQVVQDFSSIKTKIPTTMKTQPFLMRLVHRNDWNQDNFAFRWFFLGTSDSSLYI